MDFVSPLFRLVAQWRNGVLSREDSVAAQQRELLRLVGLAASTRFGREHDFGAIRDIAGFQERVPLRAYDDFWNGYWESEYPRLDNCTWPGTIPYFALTSGTTTGRTKYIPLSRDMVRSNVRAARDLLVHHFTNRPESRLFSGKSLMLGGSTNLNEEVPGVLSGDLSGIQVNETPAWTGPFMFPPRELALLSDWEEKIERIARASLNETIRAISGTPNWLLIYFERLIELAGGDAARVADVYPHLDLLVYGGIDFKPYADRFADVMQGSAADLREVYPASEGFIAIADRGQGEGMRLIADNGLFYEFIPMSDLGATNPVRHWLGTIETGVDYAVALSTCAGVWGYLLGDTVRFVETNPPRLLVTGRTSYVLSTFGEHLIDAEIEEAAAVAARAVGLPLSEFCVAPAFPEASGERGFHRYVVEFVQATPGEDVMDAFATALDAHLGALNADYQAHRIDGVSLKEPRAEAVAPGTFQAWMKARGKLGGQHKVPRVINDQALFSELVEFVAAHRKEANSQRS